MLKMFPFFLFFTFSSMVTMAAEFASEESSNERFSEVKDEIKESPVILEYPELKKFLYVPPKSPIYVGLGFAPIALMGSKLFFNMRLFQVHYISDPWDIEVFSASIGQAKSDKEFANSRHFTARISPKYSFMNIFDTGTVSAGPVFGMEYVQFTSIPARKRKGSLYTKYADLTTGGLFYGFALCETFTLNKDRKFKITQMFYKQGYDVRDAGHGWTFEPQADDPTPTILDNGPNEDEISKSTVFQIEFAYLF